MVLTNQLIYLVNIKTMRKIFSNYVCFSKCLNFKESRIIRVKFALDIRSSKNNFIILNQQSLQTSYTPSLMYECNVPMTTCLYVSTSNNGQAHICRKKYQCKTLGNHHQGMICNTGLQTATDRSDIECSYLISCYTFQLNGFFSENQIKIQHIICWNFLWYQDEGNGKSVCTWKRVGFKRINFRSCFFTEQRVAIKL